MTVTYGRLPDDGEIERERFLLRHHHLIVPLLYAPEARTTVVVQALQLTFMAAAAQRAAQ